MRMLKTLAIISAFAFPVLSQAQMDFDACKPVFEACAAQGFSKDETAPVGQKIWLNCASLIITQKKSVAKVDMDPNGADAKYCRDYREAKEKFDMDFAKKHKRAK